MSSQLKTAVVIDDSAIAAGLTIDDVDFTAPFGGVEAQLRNGQVAVSAADTHVKHLEDAVEGVAGQFAVTKQSGGANEKLRFNLDATAVTSGYVPTANGSNGWGWAAPGGGGAAPIDVTGTAGETLALRDYVYLDETAMTWFKVDTDSSPVRLGRFRGIVTQAAGIAAAASGTIRLMGEVSGYAGLTAWQAVYASSTAGGITQTRPSPVLGGSQVAIVEMGMAVSTTNIVLLPAKEVQYMKRATLANNDTLTVEHHTDAMGHTRLPKAYIGSTDAGVVLASYSDSNQDSDVPLKYIPLHANLQAWWSLNETSGTRNDSHGSNHLNDNNTVLSAAGKVGNAADFVPANSEYLSIADNAALSSGDIEYAIGGWFKLDDKTADRSLVSRYNNGLEAERELNLLYNNTADRFQFIVRVSAASYTVSANALGSPSTGVWYYIVAWHDPVGNTLNIQVNDGSVTSVAHTVGMTDTAAATTIGGRMNGGTPFMDGLIDEVAIWKRVLTAAEKTWLYNSGNGRSYTDTTTYSVKDKLAQGFQTALSSAGLVRLWLKKVGSPAGNLTVKIQTDSAGDPSGTTVTNGTSVTVAASSLSTSYGWIDFTFSTPPSLSASTQYHLVLETTGSASGINYVVWGADGSAPGYASGQMKSEVAAVWGAEAKDAIFEVVAPGTTFSEPAVVGAWSSGTRDVAYRYDDGSGLSGSTKSTGKNVTGVTKDVTLVLEVA